MKVDKDAILKQKFWILLGVFGLLWLIGLSVLYAAAGSPAAAAEADFKKAKDAIGKYTGANRPKNASFLPPWEKDIVQFDEHKKKVWKVAWDGDTAAGDAADGQKRWEGQKGMYTWPVGAYNLQAELLYPDSAKPDDPKSPMLDVDRRKWFKTEDGYLSQFVKLDDELKGNPEPPDITKPLGAVEFKGGFMDLMKPVNWTTSQRPPDVEECWLAQEDFWVKRELLKTVQAAMEAAAHMNRVEDPDKEGIKLPEGVTAGTPQQVFRNDSWQVQLVFDKGPKGLRIGPASTITNVHPSRREQSLDSARNRLGTYFRLTQDGNTVRYFNVTGVKVAWGRAVSFGAGATKEAKDGFPLSAGGDPTRPMGLEQVFDQTNAPVVAIDQIEIPKVSHRNANRPLISANADRYGKKDAPPADAAKTATTTAQGAPPAAGGGGSAGPVVTPAGVGAIPMGAPGATGGADKTADKTANSFFDRNRYLFVTDQSRHLPVAMTLTIDQSHLGEVLVAVANSRLRFQTTQVEFRRVHGAGSSGGAAPGGDRPMGMPFLPPGGVGSGGSTPPGGGGPGGSSSPGGGPGGSSSAGGSPRGPAPTPFGPPPASGTSPPAAAADEGNPNQVEVTIYGIASLYERPPQEK